MAALAGGTAYGTTAGCDDTQTLNNRAFEVDTNANLVVTNTGCVGWLTGEAGPRFRSGVTVKQDTASGQKGSHPPETGVEKHATAPRAYAACQHGAWRRLVSTLRP
jgi:hypothetical protein